MKKMNEFLPVAKFAKASKSMANSRWMISAVNPARAPSTTASIILAPFLEFNFIASMPAMKNVSPPSPTRV